MSEQDKDRKTVPENQQGQGRSRRRRRRRPQGAQGGNQQQQGQDRTQQSAGAESDEARASSGQRRRLRGGRGRGGPSQQQDQQGGNQQARQQGGRRGGQQVASSEQQAQEKGQGQRRRRANRRPRREEHAPERVEPRREPHERARGRQAGGGRGQGPAPILGERMRIIGAPRTGAVPAPIGKDRLRVIPLGGVGEVGKNMTAVESGKDIILLDAGGKFPEEDQQGIDLIIPDVTYIKERRKNFRGILLTHGHEDHIGALPYVIPQLYEGKGSPKIPIYGTPLAIGFVERKLLEARVDDMVELKTVESGERVKLGENISAEFIHVTHSIPDATSIAVHTPVGTIVDTGDFKFDPTPVMGDPADEKRLRKLGDNGVLALFSDTVRVESEGSTPSEKVVLETIDDVIGHAAGQVIIATFASNVSRVLMALKAAEKHGRKVAVAGRSMEQNTRVALDLGYLDPPEGLLVTLDEVMRLPKNKRVIVSTGSQGEPAAALARIAAGEHPKIRVGRGDLILVSATPIPGNEDTVSRTIDNLFQQGAEVVYSAIDRGVHVSGHAGQDELRRMLEFIRPTYAVPVHGEYRHMALYRELAVKSGVKRENVLLPEIGGVIEFTKSSANQRARVPSGNVLVDKLGERDGVNAVLRTRENLTEEGVVVVSLVVSRSNGELISGPDITGQELGKELSNGALREAERELKRSLTRRRKGAPQYGFLAQRVKESVAETLYRRTRHRPLILPVIAEL
ncbi:MAG TPA: ribonuclease J [Thermomicrobiales bacterium]|nr:ribonuclease J [Thermomicrobiales bacterium]